MIVVNMCGVCGGLFEYIDKSLSRGTKDVCPECESQVVNDSKCEANMTPEEIKKQLGMTDNAIEYLEGKQKEVLDKIWALACDAEPSDAVKLKALTTMLNKLVPDRTKLELDVKATAPYETLLKNLHNDGK